MLYHCPVLRLQLPAAALVDNLICSEHFLWWVTLVVWCVPTRCFNTRRGRLDLYSRTLDLEKGLKQRRRVRVAGPGF